VIAISSGGIKVKGASFLELDGWRIDPNMNKARNALQQQSENSREILQRRITSILDQRGKKLLRVDLSEH
jgi:hypothetical protein